MNEANVKASSALANAARRKSNAWPGDNGVDLYTNDVGLVPTLSEGTRGELTGYVVLAGGGRGGHRP